jgi:hypothetical protein
MRVQKVDQTPECPLKRLRTAVRWVKLCSAFLPVVLPQGYDINSPGTI